MADSIDRVFVHALQTVKKIPRTGSARPPAADRLKLYGLYKQSMEGDVVGVMARPENPSPLPLSGEELDEERKERERTRSEGEKWDAWASNAGLARTEAKRRYIDTLIQTMHQYASATQEARELVGELEFVWEQVKNNARNSSGTGSGMGSGRSAASRSSPDSGARASGGRAVRSTGSRARERDKRSIEGSLSRKSKRERTMSVTREGLRVLRPVSDADEQELEEDEDNMALARTTPSASLEGGEFPSHALPDPSAEDAGNRWRKSMEHALVRMTAEVAALREQMEAGRLFGNRAHRKSLWRWLKYWSGFLLQHLLFDIAVFAFVVLWERWKGDLRVNWWFWRRLGVVTDKIDDVAYDVGRSVHRRLPRLDNRVKRAVPKSWCFYSEK